MIAQFLAQVGNDAPSPLATILCILIIALMVLTMGVSVYWAKHFTPWIQARMIEANRAEKLDEDRMPPIEEDHRTDRSCLFF